MTRNSFSPTLEVLERRDCPSTLGVDVHGQTLRVNGDNAANVITILEGANGSVSAQIKSGATTVSRSASGIEKIEVCTGNGNDTVCFQLQGTLTRNLALGIYLGKGQDTVNLDFSPGISSPKVDIDVEGGCGQATINACIGQITNTCLNFNATLQGNGNTFTAYQMGDLLGRANVNFCVQGGAGNDTINLQADGVKIDKGAVLSADLYCGGGKDTINVGYEGVLNGLLRLQSYGGCGNDTLTNYVDVKAGSTGKLDAVQHGGSGKDILKFDLEDESGWPTCNDKEPPAPWQYPSRLKSLRAVADGGSGCDSLWRSGNVQALHCEDVHTEMSPV